MKGIDFMAGLQSFKLQLAYYVLYYNTIWNIYEKTSRITKLDKDKDITEK